MASAKKLNIGNVSEFSFDKKGRWLIWIVSARDKSGNGIQIRNMKTGVIFPLESDEAIYQRLRWTKEGDGLAILKGTEDKKYENQLFSVIGFTKFKSDSPQKVIYDPKKDENFPEGMTISPNSTPSWTEDLSGILFGIHELKEKGER